jgi:hypothetical protein
MNLFWDARQTFHTNIDEPYDHLQSIEIHETKIQGQIADILAVLPPHYVASWLWQTVNVWVFADAIPTANRAQDLFRDCSLCSGHPGHQV